MIFFLNFILPIFVTNLRIINYRPAEDGWGDNFKLLGAIPRTESGVYVALWHESGMAGSREGVLMGTEMLKKQLLQHLFKNDDRLWASQTVLVVKNLSANAGDFDSTLGQGRSTEEGTQPTQSSCLEKSVTEESGRL